MDGSDGKESACNAGDVGSIPGSGRAPGGGGGNSFQYSCLKNFMDRGAWQATVHGVAELDMTERLTPSPSLSVLLHSRGQPASVASTAPLALIKSVLAGI